MICINCAYWKHTNGYWGFCQIKLPPWVAENEFVMHSTSREQGCDLSQERKEQNEP